MSFEEWGLYSNSLQLSVLVATKLDSSSDRTTVEGKGGSASF